VKLQTNFTSFGMVPCLFTFEPGTDTATLVSEDDKHLYFATQLETLGKVTYTRGESRLVFTHDGTKYRLVFQSGGNILASTAARRLAGRSVAGSIIHNNGYDDWFVLLSQRGHDHLKPHGTARRHVIDVTPL
jgi:hypothetical protein